MKLSKKQANAISKLINDIQVSNLMCNSAEQRKDNAGMIRYNDDNDKAIIALYENHGIKLCTYDLAVKHINKSFD